MRGMIRETLLEAHERKMTILFACMTLLGAGAVLLSRNVQLNFHMETQGVDPSVISAALQDPMMRLFKAYLSFLLFLAVMGSAGHVPSMLEKGRAEYYLSKPLSRLALLIGRFVSVVVAYGSLVFVPALIVYILFAVLHSRFDLNILYLFASYALSLMVWLAVTTGAAVLSGSTAMAVMAAFLVWVAQSILGSREAIKAILNSQVMGYVIDALYHIVPKTGELEQIGFQLALARPVDNWWPLITTLLVGAAILQGSIIVFSRRDY